MINFLKYKTIYFTISVILILIGIASVVVNGYRISIDFAGGSVVEYQSNKSIDKKLVENLLTQEKISIIESKLSTPTDIILRTETLDQSIEKKVRSNYSKEKKQELVISRFETVGPVIGQETMYKTIFASFIAILGILLYITYAFKNVRYGLAAIIAMFHDFLIIIGSYSLMSHFLGAELDALFVTALLTTMSFSVHDTIVVFDKIREYKKTDKRTPIEIIANKAFTETIVRSFNNSLTIILMLLALVLLGGKSITFFAATLLIGTITGTYSSPFIATPLLVWLEKRNK